jgi:hypothetical protein
MLSSPKGAPGERISPPQPALCGETSSAGLDRARCCCRSWFMSLVALTVVNRVYDWPGNSGPWLVRQLGWNGADLAAQYALWHAAAFFALFAAGVALDAAGGVPVMGTGAACLLLGSALLLVGHTRASLIPARIIASVGYACVEISALFLMAEVFGKRQGGLTACCRGGGESNNGGGGRSCCGSDAGGGARSVGATDTSGAPPDCVRHFPQITFAMTLVQFFQRASMIPSLIMAPYFFSSFGWLGVGYVLIFGAVSLFASAAVIVIYRGWLPCCALTLWDAPLLPKLADSDKAPLLARRPGGDVVAAALDGGTAPRQPPQSLPVPLPPPLLPPGFYGPTAVDAGAMAPPPPPAPLPPPPPRCSCVVPERFNFCQPELSSAAVILNLLVGIFGQVFYLVCLFCCAQRILHLPPQSPIKTSSPLTPAPSFLPPAALCRVCRHFLRRELRRQ